MTSVSGRSGGAPDGWGCSVAGLRHQSKHLRIKAKTARDRGGSALSAGLISSWENGMRGLILGAAALCGLALQPAMAQRQCASLADQSAFEVQALRSELMVLATGCSEDQRYNAFMRRFQPDLQANERAISAYFKRNYGRSGQAEHDRFVTDMANARSRAGTQLGSDFCARNSMIFQEVMSLRNTTELAEFAAAKDLIPATVSVCHERGASAHNQVASAPAAKTTKVKASTR
ncbi:MAG: hypothetical protein AB7S57_08800 [Acetobacteraceae bacterium]